MKSPYPQIPSEKEFQRARNLYINKILERIQDIRDMEVIYVKGCGDFELYERKSGVRGARINGVNYDMTVLFLSQNREPEIHEFFINSKAYLEEPEWEEKDGEMIKK